MGGFLQLTLLEALGQAEIKNLGATLGGDDYVGAFQVTVNNAALMGVRQRISHLNAVAKERSCGQGFSSNELAQGSAFNVFHGDVGLAIGFANFVDGADVGMVQLGSGARFLKEPRPSCLVSEAAGRQHFQGYVALEPLISGAVNFTHPTRTNLLDDAIVTERAANHGTPGRPS